MLADTILQGKHKILLFRRYMPDGQATLEAAKLLFQTEHTFSYSRELERVITKDGTVVRVGGLESEVGIEALQSKDDPTAKLLRDSVVEGYKLELWEVTVDEEMKTEDDKYPAVYCRGFLDTWETGANVEEDSTISSNFTVELDPQEGFATLTAAQEEAIQYAFRDTIAIPAGA